MLLSYRVLYLGSVKTEPRIICLGHVCIDRNSTEHAEYIGWGSGTLYMSSYFQARGLRPAVISSYGPDLLPHVNEFELLSPPNMPETLTFENIVPPGQTRKLFAHKADMSLPPVLTPDLKRAIAEADILIAAMLLPTYSAEWLESGLGLAQSSCLKVLCPQGYLRSLDGDGLVSPRPFEEARHIIPLFDLVFISDEDTPDALTVAQDWKRAAPGTEVIVTNGPKGATIIGTDGPRLIPTIPIPPEEIVDSVGCGDTFAASVALALYEGRSLEDAIKTGHQAAAHKLRAVAAV
jgi:sugar/nucleoside kinase (ribokinase family)